MTDYYSKLKELKQKEKELNDDGYSIGKKIGWGKSSRDYEKEKEYDELKKKRMALENLSRRSVSKEKRELWDPSLKKKKEKKKKPESFSEKLNRLGIE